MNKDNNYDDDNFILYMLGFVVLFLSSPVIFMIIGQIAIDLPTRTLQAFFRNIVIFDVIVFLCVKFKGIKGTWRNVIYVVLALLFITAVILLGADKTVGADKMVMKL